MLLSRYLDAMSPWSETDKPVPVEHIGKAAAATRRDRD
ncbi:hypothetical protein [Kitasatospora acidiphila]